MANEEPKALNPSYIVTEKSDLEWFQVLVNRYIEKGYVPYWPLNYIMIDWRTWVFKYQQILVDPLVLERQQTTIRNITKWNISSIVTIPGTVNVSWCECNCW
jgi:hypothetical protein